MTLTSAEFVQGVIEAQLEVAQKLIVSPDPDKRRQGRAMRALFEPVFRFVSDESRREPTSFDASLAMVCAAAEVNRLALNTMAQALVAFELEGLAGQTVESFSTFFQESVERHRKNRELVSGLSLPEQLESVRRRAAEFAPA